MRINPLQLSVFWQFDPTDAPPASLPVRFQSQLGGVRAIASIADQGLVLYLNPGDCLLQDAESKRWFLLDASAADLLVDRSEASEAASDAD